MQRDAFEQHHRREEGEGHDPETADLDQQQDDRLAGGGEIGGGILDGEAGHADRAGAGEGGVEPGATHAAHRAARHFQEQSPGDDDREEGQDQDQPGVEGPRGEARLMVDPGREAGAQHRQLDQKVPRDHPPAASQLDQRHDEHNRGQRCVTGKPASLLAQVPEPVENPAALEGERDAGEDGDPVLPFRDDAGPADDRQQANHRQQGEQRVEHMPAGLHRCRRACRSFEIVHGGACYDSPHPP